MVNGQSDASPTNHLLWLLLLLLFLFLLLFRSTFFMHFPASPSISHTLSHAFSHIFQTFLEFSFQYMKSIRLRDCLLLNPLQETPLSLSLSHSLSLSSTAPLQPLSLSSLTSVPLYLFKISPPPPLPTVLLQCLSPPSRLSSAPSLHFQFVSKSVFSTKSKICTFSNELPFLFPSFFIQTFSFLCLWNHCLRLTTSKLIGTEKQIDKLQ